MRFDLAHRHAQFKCMHADLGFDFKPKGQDSF